jgi:hypothetical protein
VGVKLSGSSESGNDVYVTGNTDPTKNNSVSTGDLWINQTFNRPEVSVRIGNEWKVTTVGSDQPGVVDISQGTSNGVVKETVNDIGQYNTSARIKMTASGGTKSVITNESETRPDYLESDEGLAARAGEGSKSMAVEVEIDLSNYDNKLEFIAKDPKRETKEETLNYSAGGGHEIEASFTLGKGGGGVRVKGDGENIVTLAGGSSGGIAIEQYTGGDDFDAKSTDGNAGSFTSSQSNFYQDEAGSLLDDDDVVHDTVNAKFVNHKNVGVTLKTEKQRDGTDNARIRAFI